LSLQRTAAHIIPYSIGCTNARCLFGGQGWKAEFIWSMGNVPAIAATLNKQFNQGAFVLVPITAEQGKPSVAIHLDERKKSGSTESTQRLYEKHREGSCAVVPLSTTLRTIHPNPKGRPKYHQFHPHLSLHIPNYDYIKYHPRNTQRMKHNHHAKENIREMKHELKREKKKFFRQAQSSGRSTRKKRRDGDSSNAMGNFSFSFRPFHPYGTSAVTK
jgi:hypothetical protein